MCGYEPKLLIRRLVADKKVTMESFEQYKKQKEEYEE